MQALLDALAVSGGGEEGKSPLPGSMELLLELYRLAALYVAATLEADLAEQLAELADRAQVGGQASGLGALLRRPRRAACHGWAAGAMLRPGCIWVGWRRRGRYDDGGVGVQRCRRAAACRA